MPAPDSTLSRRQAATAGRLCNLPRLNPAATRLLAISAEVDTALEQFEEIFGSDTTLTAELLRAANSAEFGLRAPVPNIKLALLFLGTERVRSLAVSLAINRYTRFAGAAARILWEHSTAAAIIAEEIGRILRVPPAHLYTAGLTHDLGRIGLVITGGKEYTNMLSQEFHRVEESLEVERILFGMTHVEAGTFLATSWHFPRNLCLAISRHHDRLTGMDDDLVRITRAACLLAARAGFPEVRQVDAEEGEPAILDELNGRPELSPDRLRELTKTCVACS